ncbi:MAG: OmpA family protein, partial [Spirochaetes bacterium]|nr:OmpA family protein [Spirochaetota bacterium]
GYKSSKMPENQWDNWAKTTAPVIKDILNKIPDGYVLQVTGHTDGVGPEQPEGNKPGNLKISTDRAYTVYSALKKAGIDSPKLTYKGIGSSELVEGVNERAAEHRRVTFKVLPKE